MSVKVPLVPSLTGDALVGIVLTQPRTTDKTYTSRGGGERDYQYLHTSATCEQSLCTTTIQELAISTRLLCDVRTFSLYYDTREQPSTTRNVLMKLASLPISGSSILESGTPPTHLPDWERTDWKGGGGRQVTCQAGRGQWGWGGRGGTPYLSGCERTAGGPSQLICRAGRG